MGYKSVVQVCTNFKKPKTSSEPSCSIINSLKGLPTLIQSCGSGKVIQLYAITESDVVGRKTNP